MLEGEDFPNPYAPRLPEEGWTRSRTGRSEAHSKSFAIARKFKKAVAEMKNSGARGHFTIF